MTTAIALREYWAKLGTVHEGHCQKFRTSVAEKSGRRVGKILMPSPPIGRNLRKCNHNWIPAFARMTKKLRKDLCNRLRFVEALFQQG